MGPFIGGLVSIAIWQAKKNSHQVQDGLKNLHSSVSEMSKKVDEISLDVAKNYCTREELRDHIDKEEDWHDQHHIEVKELRNEFIVKAEKLKGDISEIKDMQWQIRMDQLDNKNNT